MWVCSRRLSEILVLRYMREMGKESEKKIHIECWQLSMPKRGRLQNDDTRHFVVFVKGIRISQLNCTGTRLRWYTARSRIWSSKHRLYNIQCVHHGVSCANANVEKWIQARQRQDFQRQIFGFNIFLKYIAIAFKACVAKACCLVCVAMKNSFYIFFSAFFTIVVWI